MKTLLFIAAGLMAGSAMALTTGTLDISGTVAPISILEITPNTVTQNSFSIVSTQTDVNVASVYEESNSATGYRIMMSSAQSSRLQLNRLSLNPNPAHSVPYTVKYDGVLTPALTPVPVQVKTSTTLGLAWDTSPVSVSVTGFGSTAPAGTYSDVITISIENN